MNLTFHDRTAEPVQRILPVLTIEPSGRFLLNGAAAKALKLQAGGAALLVSNEQNEWFIVFQPVAERQHFAMVRRGQTAGLSFNSLAVVQSYHKAMGLTGKEAPSIKLMLTLTPVKHEGLKLFRLQPLPGGRKAPAFLPPASTPRLDDATLYRLNETVRELAGMRLDKQPEQKLTKALGLLQANAEWLPTITGGANLLAKLQGHFGHTA